MRDGGADDGRLRPFLSPELFEETSRSYDYLRKNKWHGVGRSAFTLTLQRYDNTQLVADLCRDMSSTDLVDTDGHSVVEPGRRLRLPFEVEFDLNDSLRIVRLDYLVEREC